MRALAERFIYPALRNFNWRPNRELVLLLAAVAIVLNGAVDLFNGKADAVTAVETAVLALTGLFTRGQSTSLVEPRDQDGHELVAGSMS